MLRNVFRASARCSRLPLTARATGGVLLPRLCSPATTRWVASSMPLMSTTAAAAGSTTKSPAPLAFAPKRDFSAGADKRLYAQHRHFGDATFQIEVRPPLIASTEHYHTLKRAGSFMVKLAPFKNRSTVWDQVLEFTVSVPNAARLILLDEREPVVTLERYPITDGDKVVREGTMFMFELNEDESVSVTATAGSGDSERRISTVLPRADWYVVKRLMDEGLPALKAWQLSCEPLLANETRPVTNDWS